MPNVTAATEPAMTSGELLKRLTRHYLKPVDLPGGVVVPEVTWGRAGGPRCDALHVGFTSTSGRILTGHELKVTRADWRHELDQPHKADCWAGECHRWVVVAPSTAVVPPEELPDGWGLMVVNPRTTTRLDVVVKPRTRERDSEWSGPSWTATLSILSRLDTLRLDRDRDAADKARQAVRADVDRLVAREVERRELMAGNRTERLELLRQIHEALDVQAIHDGEPRRYGPRSITLDELRSVAPILAGQRGLRDAAEQLVGKHVTPLASIRNALRLADEAIEALRRIVAADDAPDRAR